jgi:cyclohexyl-isocyanide hydratase
MKMAFILFDGMTSLDLIGFYDAVTRLRLFQSFEHMTWDFCAMREEIVDDRGMTFRIRHVRPHLSGYDLVFVPGGFATRQLRHDAAFVGWLQTAREAEYKVSVCTGALLLGSAGFLEGKRATTNASAYELLAPYCSEVVKARVVRDGRVFTGGGVSASIDLGLYVIESLAGVDVAIEVQQKMDYPYYRAGQKSGAYMSWN